MDENCKNSERFSNQDAELSSIHVYCKNCGWEMKILRENDWPEKSNCPQCEAELTAVIDNITFNDFLGNLLRKASNN